MSSSRPTELAGYRLMYEVGRGAHSVVFRGEREGSVAAVKVWRGSTASAEEIRRFFREAAALARIQSSHVVRVLAVDLHGGLPFLITEFIDGRTLADVLKQGAMTEAQVTRLAIEAGEALESMHRLGLVHGDIKPQNLMLDAEGSLRVVDLEFAGEMSAGEGVVGTLQYASPEQNGMIHRPVDGRSDLYSLGVVLYECLAGRLPFVSENAAELARQHALTPPPELAALRPGVSAGLSAIVTHLLAKDPDDRYQSGASLLTDLPRVAQLDERVTRQVALELGHEARAGHRVAHEPALVGREEQLAELRKSLAAAQEGKGQLALVRGEPGTGKSRLIREALARAEQAGMLLVTGKAGQGEPIPFAVLAQALGQLLRRARRWPREEREDFERHVTSSMRGAESELVRICPALLPFSGAEQQLGALTAPDRHVGVLSDFLIQLATFKRGLALFVDDVQWLDESSRAVLRHVTSHFQAARIFMVGSARSDPASLQSVDRFARENREAISVDLTLERLSPDAVTALIVSALGGGELDPAIVEQLLKRGAGNPFATGETLRAMLDAGVIRPSFGRWEMDPDGLESLALPDDVLDLVVNRVRQLSPSTRRVLTAAAVFGGRFQLDLLPQLAEVGEAQVMRAISEARHANLLEHAHGQEYAFVHDRIWEALFFDVDEHQRRMLHQRLAELLDAVPDVVDEDHSIRVAFHYRNGNPEVAPLPSFLANYKAGQRASEIHADTEAYEALAAAVALLPLLPPQGVEVHLYRELGTVCTREGRIDESEAWFNKGIALATDPIDQAQFHASFAKLAIVRSDESSAARSLDAGLTAAGFPPARTTLGMVLSVLWYWLRFLWIAATKQHELDPSRRRALTVLTTICDSGSYFAYHRMNTFELVTWNIRAAYAGLRLGRSRPMVWGAIAYGTLLAALGMQKWGLRWCDLAIDVGRELGDKGWVARATLAKSWSYAFSGSHLGEERLQLKMIADDQVRWLDTNDMSQCYSSLVLSYLVRGQTTRAAHFMEQHRRNVLAVGEEYKLVINNVYAIWLAAAQGSPAAAKALIAEGEQKLRDAPGDVSFRGSYSAALAFYWLELGELGPNLEQALERFKSMKITPAMAPYHIHHFWMAQGYARLEQLRRAPAAEQPAAMEKLESALSELRFSGLRYPNYEVHRLVIQAGLHAFRGKARRAGRLLDKAQQLAFELESPRATFRVALERARLFRASGNAPASRQLAQQALDLAVELGCVQWEKAVLAEYPDVARVGPSPQPSGSSLRDTGSQLRARGHLDALIQVSLASAQVLDPSEQVRRALDAAIRVMGAERAFLFLSSDHKGLSPEGQLQTVVGRDHQGKDLPELTGYSSTIVGQVRARGKAMVVSGNDDGEAIGSRSMVAHGLRSIIAGPVMLQDKQVGVLYLDNKLVSGAFTHEDVQVVMAIGTHIVIAHETTRAAGLELEKRTLENDLELTAAVQTLFLPKEELFETPAVRLAAALRPAQRCAGDWWWYLYEPGKLTVLVGDVTGHGAPAAMVTAAAASLLRSRFSAAPAERDVGQLLKEVHHELAVLTRGLYTMGILALTLDEGSGQLRVWSGGMPPILLLSPDRTVSALGLQGTPLASDSAFELGTSELALQPGSRLLLYTDGIPERVTTSGRPFGSRKLGALFTDAAGARPQSAVSTMLSRLSEACGGTQADDDITCVLVEYGGDRSGGRS